MASEGYEAGTNQIGIEAALWFVVGGLLVADIITTTYGLRIGLVESNPVGYGVFEVSGVYGLTIIKLWSIGIAFVLRTQLPPKYTTIIPVCLIGPWGYAVVSNIGTIMAVA